MTAVLERQLLELAERLDVDARPSLVADVIARLDEGAHPSLFVTRHRTFVAAAAAIVLAIATVAVVPQTRHAVARFFGIGSTRIEQLPDTVPTTQTSAQSPPSGGTVAPSSVDSTDTTAETATTATATEATFPSELHLGPALSADEASQRTGLPVPVAPGLEPASGTFADVADPVQVIVVYPPSDGLPPSPVASVGALLSITSGYVDEGYFLKLVDPGETVVESILVTTAGGDVVPGIWLGGTPHVYAIDRTGRGEMTTDELRLATNTLLWQVGDVVYRLESSLERDHALAVAATIVLAGDGE